MCACVCGKWTKDSVMQNRLYLLHRSPKSLFMNKMEVHTCYNSQRWLQQMHKHTNKQTEFHTKGKEMACIMHVTDAAEVKPLKTSLISAGVLVTWHILSWSGDHEFKPQNQSLMAEWLVQVSQWQWNVLLWSGGHEFKPQNQSLMTEWLVQVSQWHKMYCHDLEVVSSNPSQGELGVRSTSGLSRIWTSPKKHWWENASNI